MSKGGVPNRAEFVVVANRLPVDLERLEDGTEQWKHSPGGLVTALEPFLRARDGAWVGWPGVPDLEAAPFVHDGLKLHPVPLSTEEFRDYYEGFSNATLWPLFHDVVMPPVFDRSWWQAYQRVNRRFAEAAAEVSAEGATVWVQDYQLQLVPSMLRELRPDLRIGFFLHIPFPPVELFMQLPWRTEIVRGLLGADLVGFHRPGGAQNFLWLARRLAGFEPSRGQVGSGPGRAWCRSGPDRAEWGRSRSRSPLRNWTSSPGPGGPAAGQEDPRGTGQSAEDPARRRPPRLHKGIDVRLRAITSCSPRAATTDEVVMIQIATPSRERVEHYKQMREEIEREVGRINGEFGQVGRPRCHCYTSVDRKDLVAFYSAADVMVVTPLRDGMNLVCKEYVASRHDLGGALVLSEFAGAAAELTSAFLVNPHNLDGVKDALLAALNMDQAEGRRRMRALRRQVLTHDVDRWARSFLEALGTPLSS